eukprot:COSAG02_NODE_2807_length_7985_cov_659.432412_6_plen_111_part_00
MDLRESAYYFSVSGPDVMLFGPSVLFSIMRPESVNVNVNVKIKTNLLSERSLRRRRVLSSSEYTCGEAPSGTQCDHFHLCTYNVELALLLLAASATFDNRTPLGTSKPTH